VKRKSWLIPLLLFLGWLALLGSSLAAAPPVERIDKDALKAMLGNPDLLLIDVRQPRDWSSSERKITGARRLLPAEVASWAPTLPKDKKIVLYCA
jgi:rhodanese-related sulfurtransferase